VRICRTTSLLPVQEDVLYALSETDAISDMRIEDPSKLTPDGRAKMVYLLSQEGGSTPTLSYLRSVYNTPGQPRTQWGNFVERVKGLAAAQGIKGLPKVVEEVSLVLLQFEALYCSVLLRGSSAMYCSQAVLYRMPAGTAWATAHWLVQ
jgi:hypothetical protein